MTSDTQKAREWLEDHDKRWIDNISKRGWTTTDSVYAVMEAYAAHVTAQKDAEIADLRTAFNKFALNVMVAAIVGIADAAIVKQAIYTEHTSLAAVRTLAEKHKSLRAQAEKDKAEIERLRKDAES